MKDGPAIAFDEMFDAQGRVRPHYEAMPIGWTASPPKRWRRARSRPI